MSIVSLVCSKACIDFLLLKLTILIKDLSWNDRFLRLETKIEVLESDVYRLISFFLHYLGKIGNVLPCQKDKHRNIAFSPKHHMIYFIGSQRL